MADKILSELNKGAWSGVPEYTVGDIVSISGSSYLCVLNHTNQQPPNATYWALLASKGDTGPQGVKGNSGTNIAISPFVTAKDGAFWLKGQEYKYVGGNYYPLFWSSQEDANTVLESARKKGITKLRAWFFDSGKPPADTSGNFRYLFYPIGTNLLTNGDFETDTTGWTLQSNFARSAADFKTGTHSLLHSESSGYAIASTTVTVLANTDYVLTFWYKMNQIFNLPPRVVVGTAAGDNSIADGGFQEDTAGEWKQKQVRFNSGPLHTSITISFQNWNGHSEGYYDNINLCLQQTPSLVARESTWANADWILNRARELGIKITLVFADNNAEADGGYDTKKYYVKWANIINPSTPLTDAFPYSGFFDSNYCISIFKDMMTMAATRKNTVNGIYWRDDPTIFSIEDGNELRYDDFGPENGTQNQPSSESIAKTFAWFENIGAHVRTQFPNHLHTFGDVAHTSDWVEGDTVSNGSGYGSDYRKWAASPYQDYNGYHVYPSKGGTQLLKYGQRLGYPDAISGDGFRAQLQDFIDVPHSYGKPAILEETGIDGDVVGSNTYYTLFNRYEFAKALFVDWFDTGGGNGIDLWHLSVTPPSGSYDIALDSTGGEAITDNSDDTNLVNLIKQYNDKFQYNILSSQREIDLRYLSRDLPRTTKTANYTITKFDYIILVNATSGNIVISLPSAIGIDGRPYIIKKVDGTANTVTITTQGAETIDGASTYVLDTQYEAVSIASDNANYYII
jgi:hypothetical protein